MEYDDIHGSAADSQKCGDQAQHTPYQPASNPVFNMSGSDARPKTDIEKNPKHKKSQYGRLNAAHQMICTGKAAQDVEYSFSPHAAKSCADSQRQTAFPLQTVRLSVFLHGDSGVQSDGSGVYNA